MSQEHLRYPTGRFIKPDALTVDERHHCIEQIEVLPQQLTEVLSRFNDSNLENQYREGSWTARQVFHHIGDSHVNAYVRIKLTLTEHEPVIKPYLENEWVKLSDMSLPPENALALVTIIHERLTLLFRSMEESEWKRRYFHPESKQYFSLEQMLALYSWHGNHHLAHLKLALNG